MIRLNQIFGRKSTRDHDAQSDAAPHPAFAPPPDSEAEWDEDLADAYLLAQEKALTATSATHPSDPTQPEMPATVEKTDLPHPPDPLPNPTEIQDRAVMARQQLAAAQAQVLPAPAIPLDLSGFVGADPGQGGRRPGRVKTRLLGFDHTPGLTLDPIEVARAATPTTSHNVFPVGWIVVIRGPGRGAHFTLFNGVSQIGRGEDQAIKLDFGDGSISRSNHAAIAYDDETNGFFLGHGGKTNIVRLNDRPVISTETLVSEDTIRIGETTLLFVALCGNSFRWSADQAGSDNFGST